MLVVVPAYNEAESLPKLIPELLKLYPPNDILVVDDGSSDNTSEVATNFGVIVLKHCINRGIGATVQTGIKYAQKMNYSHMVQIDGDGQHPPDQIGLLMDQMLKTKANIVVGSRFYGIESFQSTGARRAGIRIISYTIKILFRKTINDTTSGMRLFDRKAIELFAIDYPIEFPEPISLGVAFEKNFTVAECAVNMRERQGGQSSIFGLKTFTYMLRVIGYLVLVRLGRHV